MHDVKSRDVHLTAKQLLPFWLLTPNLTKCPHGVPLTAKQLVAFTCRTACAVLKSSLSEKIQPMSEADIPSRHCVVSALGAFVKLCALLHGNESSNVQYLAGYFRR